METDYIIVGQGIAGSVLAFKLLKEKKQVLVVDANPANSSSKVAAGLYNPIVFKRIVRSWMVDELLPVADRLYEEMELFLNQKFHYKRPIVKLFSNETERSFWQEKSTDTSLISYLSNQIEFNFQQEKLISEFGSSSVKKSGNIDVPLMLKNCQKYLLDEKILLIENLNFDDLILTTEGVEWKGNKAKKIIFCEGHQCAQNPYFNWLPFVLTKGEILTVRIENFEKEAVINKGVFVLPLGNSIYKIGATYEWKDLNETPSEQGKSELLGKLSKILKVPFEILDHQAGIRPTVIDRRPIIGLHPEFKQIAIFNGMGTKAVMLSPYFADKLYEYFNKNLALNKEVSVERFYKYWKAQ